MDISFTCEKCGEALEIDEAGAGVVIDCPKCAASIMVPDKRSTKSGESHLTAQQSRKLCPSCGSEQVIKASAAFEQGTSIIAGKSRQIGAMLIHDSDGGLDVAPGVSGGSFSGVQQTTLAKRLSPPEPPKKKHGGVIIALGAMMALTSLLLFADKFAEEDDRVMTAVFLVGGIGVVLAGLVNFQPKKKYVRAMQQHHFDLDLWHKTWYCRTCGSTFRI